MVGAAPLSSAAFASCFGGDGLATAASAVLLSAGCGSDACASDLGRAVRAAVCTRFAAAAGLALGAEAWVDWVLWSSLFDPNRLPKKPPIPPELPGAADAT